MLIIYHLSAATECMIQFYDTLYLVESFLRFCMIESTPPEHKADIDGDFLTAIAGQPNEILKCAMYLFLGYLAAQLNSPSHAATEAPHQPSNKDAIRMKTTVASPTVA